MALIIINWSVSVLLFPRFHYNLALLVQCRCKSFYKICVEKKNGFENV